MLIFTNREVDTTATGPAAFMRRFQPGSETLAVAQVVRSGAGSFALGGVSAGLDKDAVMQLLVPLFQGPRPVLVYLHGNNNTPAACFERCARLAEIYGVEVIGFSWPSEGYQASGEELSMLLPGAVGAADDGNETVLAKVDAGNRGDGWIQQKIRRYHQAQTNAKDGSDALARFLRLVAAARLYANAQRLTIAAHSLGCHFVQYTIETETAAEALAAAHHIVLLAACCRATGHEDWVGKLNPKGRVFITYNSADYVLLGASFADGGQTKLGSEPGERVRSPKVRYVSFTHAESRFSGHGYFVRETGKDVPKHAKKLFGRIFAGEADIREDQGEAPRKVYPVGCDADGSTCYMAAPLLNNDDGGRG